jgi:hypothetical protein
MVPLLKITVKYGSVTANQPQKGPEPAPERKDRKYKKVSKQNRQKEVNLSNSRLADNKAENFGVKKNPHIFS